MVPNWISVAWPRVVDCLHVEVRSRPRRHFDFGSLCIGPRSDRLVQHVPEDLVARRTTCSIWSSRDAGLRSLCSPQLRRAQSSRKSGTPERFSTRFRTILVDKNLRFDEWFDFHFYDMDFCRQAEIASLGLGLWPISLIHLSAGNLQGRRWLHSLKVYRLKYRN